MQTGCCGPHVSIIYNNPVSTQEVAVPVLSIFTQAPQTADHVIVSAETPSEYINEPVIMQQIVELKRTITALRERRTLCQSIEGHPSQNQLSPLKGTYAPLSQLMVTDIRKELEELAISLRKLLCKL